jgi:glutaredoxin
LNYVNIKGDDLLILVIGTENCSRCIMTKTILINKQIDFEYKLIDSFSDEDKDKYMNMAQQAGQMSFPLIVKDNKIITLWEV